MGLTKTLFMTLVWISLLYFAGMYLFTKGFLLTRIEISQKNSGSCSQARGSAGKHGKVQSVAADCPQPVRYKRAVIMLVDALRYDFAIYNDSLTKLDAAPFQNKLPIMQETIAKYPERAVLFKALADPPTTTLQRLKGLITGSLPTFVDAGHNFASFEISEDNIVDQLVEAGKRVVFMGDDTWMTLFKNKFHKSFPFPSFNVKDLHTVDEGILSHLLPEIKGKGWDVIIAHFLGVDHCGHWLGPYHSSMSKKLTQMNVVIKSVIKHLEEDTILFVLGDHGMTRTGDHGGDSPEELSAALFLYSPSKIIHTMDVAKKVPPDTVAQIDFVPTLSLLLGVPIPFSNLGSIIPPLFSLPTATESQEGTQKLPESLRKIYRRVRSLRTNAQQIHHYVDTYSKVAGDFPQETHSSLEEMFTQAETEFGALYISSGVDSETKITEELMLSIEEDYRSYIVGVREMCRSVWAKFEMAYVYQGLLIVVLAVSTSAIILLTQQYADADGMDAFINSLMKKVLMWISVAVIVGIALSFTALSQATSLIFVPSVASIVATISHFCGEISSVDLRKVFWSCTNASALKLIVVLLPALVHAAMLTSDSYVINEGRAIVYFTQSVIVFLLIMYSLYRYDAYYSARPKTKGNNNFGKIISSPTLLTIMLGLAVMVCVRLSSLFMSCREEQYWCSQYDFLQPLSTLPSEQSNYRSYRYLLSMASIAALPSTLIYWLNCQGNLSSDSGQVYSIRYALPIASVCICMFWGQQALPQKLQENSPAWQQVVFPQIAYIMIVIAAILQWTVPLNLLLVSRTRTHSAQTNTSVDQVSLSSEAGGLTHRTSAKQHPSNTQAQNIDSAQQRDNSNDEHPPLVYGLGTVFSATYLHVLVTIVLLIALLNSDGLGPAVLLMAVEALLYLELYASTRRKQLMPLKAMPDLYRIGFFSVPWYAVAGWSLMATQYFFATGHQATFTAINFESAYIGFNSDFPRCLYFIPATLVSLNTFGSQVFFAAMLPLLLIWPFTRGLWATGQKSISEEEQQGELNLHTYASETVRALFQVFVMFLIFQACDLIGTMVAAAVLRRHLMAWSVFAPRFIFQGVAFGIMVPTILVSFLFFCNIQRSLVAWFDKIPS